MNSTHTCVHLKNVISEVSSKVDSIISSDSVVVFSKTTCPFCTKVKALFVEKKVDVKYVELDQVGELSKIPW